jgi:hypothetical protein
METSLLSGVQLQQLIDALGMIEPASDLREKRRTQFCAAVRIAPVTAETIGEPFEVVVHDLSVSGLGFVHPSQMQRGQQFQVITAHNETRQLSIRLKVMHCQPIDDGRFRIGASFTQVCSDCHGDEPTDSPLMRSLLGQRG